MVHNPSEYIDNMLLDRRSYRWHNEVTRRLHNAFPDFCGMFLGHITVMELMQTVHTDNHGRGHLLD